MKGFVFDSETGHMILEMVRDRGGPLLMVDLSDHYIQSFALILMS